MKTKKKTKTKTLAGKATRKYKKKMSIEHKKIVATFAAKPGVLKKLRLKAKKEGTSFSFLVAKILTKSLGVRL